MKIKYWFLILLILALPFMVLARTNDVDIAQLAIDTAAKVNALSAPVNPYAGPIGIILGILGSIWGIFSKFKRSKKEQQLAIVIKGVEAAGNPDVKQNIKTLAGLAGIAKDLDASVQAVVEPKS